MLFCVASEGRYGRMSENRDYAGRKSGRIQPAGDIEDIQVSVRGAPISRDADWLPAVEQFGEGIFIHFDEMAIQRWLQNTVTALRHEQLLAGYGHWQKRFAGKAPPYPGTPYMLLHSIFP